MSCSSFYRISWQFQKIGDIPGTVFSLERNKADLQLLSDGPLATPLPPFQGVKRKPRLEMEQQLHTDWEKCQLFLVSDPLYKVPAGVHLKFIPSSYFIFDIALHFSKEHLNTSLPLDIISTLDLHC